MNDGNAVDFTVTPGLYANEDVEDDKGNTNTKKQQHKEAGVYQKPYCIDIGVCRGTFLAEDVCSWPDFCLQTIQHNLRG